jgi:2-C-methyl-D-erythritol 2,4-cyclodiphosphate synthase
MCSDGIENSSEYLRVALSKLASKNKKLSHISISFECSRPKLENRFNEMRKNLSVLCGISEENIGLTATSGEKLTSFGRGEGVNVFALVSLK